ncbi:MAG: DedA family protein [Gemmatimonadaceae bacterium]
MFAGNPAQSVLALLQAAAAPPDAASFVSRLWAYLTLGATGIITEEATPLIGGLAAHDRRLHLLLVVLCVAIGTWVAGLALYYIGRWRGRWAQQRWPRLSTVIAGAFKLVRRHPWRTSMAVRWAYGLRLTLPIACGAARVPLAVYLIGTAVSCMTWAFAFTMIGWAFGRTTLLVLGHARRYENYLVALIVLMLAIGFWLMRKKHVEDEVVEVLAAGDTGPIPKVTRPDHL